MEGKVEWGDRMGWDFGGEEGKRDGGSGEISKRVPRGGEEGELHESGLGRCLRWSRL